MERTCIFSANDIADWFIAYAEIKDTTVSATKLQKLLYFAWAEYSINNELPLFNDKFKALKYGPAISSVLQEQNENYVIDEKNNERKVMRLKRPVSFKKYGDTNAHLIAIWNTYGTMKTDKLVELSHNDSPWQFTKANEIIDENLIKGFYIYKSL